MSVEAPSRADKNEWRTILDQMQTLIRNAEPHPRIAVVCRDGTHVGIKFRAPAHRSEEITEFTVTVDRKRQDEMRQVLLAWCEDIRNPARGMFVHVPVFGAVDLIWRHGGVALGPSREATARTEE